MRSPETELRRDAGSQRGDVRYWVWIFPLARTHTVLGRVVFAFCILISGARFVLKVQLSPRFHYGVRGVEILCCPRSA